MQIPKNNLKNHPTPFLKKKGHPTPSGSPVMWYPVAQDSHNVSVIISLFSIQMTNHHHHPHNHHHHHHHHAVPRDWHEPRDGFDRRVLGPDGHLARELGRDSGGWWRCWCQSYPPSRSSSKTSLIKTIICQDNVWLPPSTFKAGTRQKNWSWHFQK